MLSQSIYHQIKKKCSSFMVHIILICIIFLIIFPYFKSISNTFMSANDLLDKTVTFIPKVISTEVLNLAFEGLNYWGTILNTFWISLIPAVLQMISCCMIAYGFARFNFKGKNILFSLVLLSLIIPPQVIMSPLFIKFRFFDLFAIFKSITGQTINLIDSLWPLTILSITGFGLKNGLYIYLLRQFFRGLPNELEEAAKVDGAGFIRTFIVIMLPNAIPILLTVLLFSFSWQWTDNYFSAIFFQNFEVISRKLAFLTTYKIGNLDPVMINAMMGTAVLLTIFPLFLIYLGLQKFFVQGIVKSGIVG